MKWRPALLLVICLFGLATEPTPSADRVVAESGTLRLTLADVRRLVDSATPELRQQMQQDSTLLPKLVRNELVRQMLLDQARADKFDQRPDVALRAQQAHDAVIVNSYLASLATLPSEYPSDDELKAAYDGNKTRFMLPRQYHVAQILVAVPATADSQGDAAAHKKARDMRQSLERPGTDFAALARQRSDDRATAEKGGDMGWVREDQLIQAVRDAVAGLQPNGITDPIRTADGWHILQLVATKPAGPIPLADVREQLRQALRQQRVAQDEQTLIDQMLRKHPIQLDEIQLQSAIQH